MATKRDPTKRRAAQPSARDRLLAAADELFYEEGVHRVGIDRVTEQAGVAKASLYNTFGSKDELIKAYLAGRHALWQAYVERKVAELTEPRDRLLAVFDALGELFARPTFRGCAFLNASAEAPPESSVHEASNVFRTWVRDMFVQHAREVKARHPERLAEQLVVLYDGATVVAQMDHDPAAAFTARSLAILAIDADLPRRTTKRS